MALPIRDGNQSLTTLSTIIVNSAHVPAHSVVSLGSQAITDIAQAVSGVELGPNTISALENISVTFGVGTSITIGNVVSITGGLTNSELRASSVTIGGSVTANLDVSNLTGQPNTFLSDDNGNVPSLAVNIGFQNSNGDFSNVKTSQGLPVSGSVTAVISGTPSVTFTQASVTFTQASVTFGSITGSVSVLNLPATQTVTFTQASVTFGTPVVTGSVSVLNFPSTQTIAGTVTANVVSSSNIGIGFRNVNGDLINVDNIGSNLPVSIYNNFGDAAVGADGNNQIAAAVGIGHNSNGQFNVVGENSPLPISGTVTANLANVVTTDTFWNVPAIKITGGNGYGIDIAGKDQSSVRALFDEGGGIPVYPRDNAGLNAPFPVAGTVTVGNSVTIGSITAVSRGPVVQTDTAIPADPKYMMAVGGLMYSSPNEYRALRMGSNGGVFVDTLPAISGTVTVGNSVTIGSVPNGSLTTRFGTPSTANSVFATSAVTNASRKYLFIQNVTTQSNILNVGIGFNPTTTQGIQLQAGAGITFESSYIPTGAVYVLSSVTNSPFTILEA